MGRRILVHGNHLVIGQQTHRERINILQVAGNNEGSRQQTPQSHMRVLFIRGQPRLDKRSIGPVGLAQLADLENVRIVPMSRAHVLLPAFLGKADAADTAPMVLDISRRSPQIGQPGQLFHMLIRSRIGQTQHDIAPGLIQCFPDAFRRGHVIGFPIHLHVIESPFGPLPGVAVKQPYGPCAVGMLTVNAGIASEYLILLQTVLFRDAQSCIIRLLVRRASADKAGIRPHPRR